MKKLFQVIAVFFLLVISNLIFALQTKGAWCSHGGMDCWDPPEDWTKTCFPPGTEITVVENPQEIDKESLFSNLEQMEKAGIKLGQKAIENVEPGVDYVLSFDEQKGKYAISLATDKIEHEKEEREIQKIILENGTEISATEEHLFFIKRKEEMSSEEEQNRAKMAEKTEKETSQEEDDAQEFLEAMRKDEKIESVTYVIEQPDPETGAVSKIEVPLEEGLFVLTEEGWKPTLEIDQTDSFLALDYGDHKEPILMRKGPAPSPNPPTLSFFRRLLRLIF